MEFYLRCNVSELNEPGKPLKKKFILSKAVLDIHELPNDLNLES